MRPDEAHLPVALRVVAHGGEHDVYAVLAKQRDPRGGIDTGEGRLDAQPAGQRTRHIDVVTRTGLTFTRAEQRIVFAHAGAEAVLAEDPHQPVDVGLRAGAGGRRLGAGVGDQAGERRVGCLGPGGQREDRQQQRQAAC